jgi:hypothetical protein
VEPTLRGVGGSSLNSTAGSVQQGLLVSTGGSVKANGVPSTLKAALPLSVDAALEEPSLPFFPFEFSWTG